MEEYLQNMKCLRLQMNDFEEEAAKRSVEEQRLKTAIDALENDLRLVRSENKRLNEEAEDMVRTKAQIGSQIAEKQRKFTSMEMESSTLSQTLELLQQEMLSTSVKLQEKRAYYTKVTDELSAKLQEQQDYFTSHEKNIADGPPVEKSPYKQMSYIEGNPSVARPVEVNMENMEDEISERHKELMSQLESIESKHEELEAKTNEITLESTKIKQHIEEMKIRFDSVPTPLKEMDAKALEEEHKALLSDKAGEIEYLQSIQDQIKQLKLVKPALSVEGTLAAAETHKIQASHRLSSANAEKSTRESCRFELWFACKAIQDLYFAMIGILPVSDHYYTDF